jgi:hypothetical protein
MHFAKNLDSTEKMVKKKKKKDQCQADKILMMGRPEAKGH